MSKDVSGVVVPIPTLPLLSIRIRSVGLEPSIPLVRKIRSPFSSSAVPSWLACISANVLSSPPDC